MLPPGGVDLLPERHVGKHDAGDERDEQHPDRLHADDLGDGARRPIRQRDAEVQQDVVQLAAEQVVALRPAGELLAGDEQAASPRAM